MTRKITTLTTLLGLIIAMPATAAEALHSIHTPQGSGNGAPYWAIPQHKAPGDPTTLYMSMDMGETWDVTVPLPTNTIEPPAITGLGHAWEFIYVATAGEGIFRTEDGRNWEKWNEADVSIDFIRGRISEPVVAITEHGATFVHTGGQFHNTFTQVYDIPLNVTAVSMTTSTYYGTADGHLYHLFSNGELHMTDATGGRPGPLPGAVREILEIDRNRAYLVEDSLGRNRVYTHSGYVGPFDRMMLDGEPVYADAIGDAAGGLAVLTTGDAQRLVYTCDNGATWTDIPLPVLGGVNSFEMGGCNSSYPHWRVRLATDQGGFDSTDQGLTWRAFGDTGSEATGSLRTAHSDIGIHMVSPTPTQNTIANTTSRFELDVTNHGDERVENIRAVLEFTVWYEGSTRGSSSRGTSIKIDGVECNAGRDAYYDPISFCDIDRLEPGESARIVWIHGLGENAFSMQLTGEVYSERLRDSNSNNNRLDFSPNVRSAAEITGDGGGGALGSFWLLAVLAFALTRGHAGSEPFTEGL